VDPIFAHVTANTGIFHQLVMRAGTAFNATSATCAQEHDRLRAVMRTPMAAGDLDEAINSFSDLPTRLVTVATQVAQAAVEGHILEGEQINRFRGLEGKVGTREGGVDLVAGAAVLPGWIWIAGFNFVRIEPGGDTFAESATGVTSCTAATAPPYEGFA
jgi:hypothetical protein